VKIALSWLRAVVDIPASANGRDVANRLVRVGFEVESVEQVGSVSGPVVVGEVVGFEAEPQKNGKTIRWCQVRVAAGAEPRGIVCGASNFAVGDRVVVALPGAVLPGGFEISARKTYGHVSDGMICSVRELGIGDEHDGILVLPADSPLGADAADVLGFGDEVLDIGPTPDRGYGMSVRGVARELAAAYGVEFRDPAAIEIEPWADDAWPVRIDDPAGCDRFVALALHGLAPANPSPDWIRRRLQVAGIRSISLAVDVTNYVMLELGQPLHAYDLDRLQGEIVVRRAAPGEKLRTLDVVDRALHVDDLVIADDRGPIGIAGVMGGASTEINASTSRVLLEAAHFTPSVISRAARRHSLLSEASRRFERGVDPGVAAAAARRAADLLVEFGEATLAPAMTDAGVRPSPTVLRIPADLPSRVIGLEYLSEDVVSSLHAVGCGVESVGHELVVTIPSWRHDLRDPYDLVEEVARLVGYEKIPSVLPIPPASAGLTDHQRALRRVSRALAATGHLEAPSYPFIGQADLDALGLPAADPRRRTVRLANPISDEQPELRTTLLPGLLATLRRNLSRGNADLALFEIGLVFRVDDGLLPDAPRLPVDRRPTDEQIAALNAALPRQPRRLAVALAGERERSGWWGAGRATSWQDALDAVRITAREAGTEIEFRADDDHLPWHPGRCAALWIGGAGGTAGAGGSGAVLVGHAGELHPRVVEALGLPARTAAAELDLDAVIAAGDVASVAPVLSTYPLAISDIALVVPPGVAAADVESALRGGAGPLLENVRLFDVYTGAGVESGSRSLAYRLSLRAADHTLTAEETNAIRDAAVAEAGRRVGAVLRS
jgi:phenylalanyl-tRNA synthetase beta chain